MKPIRKHLKAIAIFLAIIFLVSSCKVYHSKTVSVDEAVYSSKWVRVKAHDGETYRFKKLEKTKGKLVGVLLRNSDDAYYLTSYIIDSTNSGKNVHILIPDAFISKIQLQNKELSTVLSIVIPVLVIGGALIIAAENMSINPGLGGN